MDLPPAEARTCTGPKREGCGARVSGWSVSRKRRRGAAAVGPAQQAGEWADGYHAEADQDERPAEEAHGAASEIEEVAEREVVFAALGEQRGDVGVRIDVVRGNGEEEGDGGAEGAERNEQPAMPAEGAARGDCGEAV